MSELRVGVIGVGVMGANHARVARQLRRAHLAAVVDSDLSRAHALADVTGARAASDLDEVLELIDLAVLAVPTSAHVDAALKCLAAGVNVLVEKPIAGSVPDGERLVRAASDTGLTLAVGHVERFNAAVVELPRLLEIPLHVKATRISPFSPRISDGVIHDLMIHDLDIVLSLVGPDVAVASVSGVAREIKGAGEDLAVVNVVFDNGLTASFETSRLAQSKVRSIEITQDDSVISADLLRQDITIHRMTRHEYLADDGVRYRQSSVVEFPFLEQRGEPLLVELQDVVDSVIDGRPPRVSGAAGLRALALADQISATVTRV